MILGMGKKNVKTRSFNTVKHSNRPQRIKRQRNQRIVLLSIFLVIILIASTAAVFGIWSLADTIITNIRDGQGTQQDGPNGDPTPETPPAEIIYTNFSQISTATNLGELIVINNAHSYDPAKAANLETIHGSQPKDENGYNIYSVGNPAWKLNATALDALNQMLQKNYEVSDGADDIKVGSAYRTAEEQENLNSSVKPGFSDHHSGYCLTLKTEDGYLEPSHWIYENCHKYGFIVRYPEGKEDKTGVSDYGWCFRYVGVAHATYIKANNLCLEEYVELLKNSYASGVNLSFTGIDGNKYEVYYTPAGMGDSVTTIRVPANFEYTLSGDNMGGFIVTVNRSKPISA